tara:strand:- start:1024 stop:1398 length:375 start_codon:yes stop_codon:yes gene_type:complete
MKHKYKILEQKDDSKETVIEKSGVKIEITLGNMERQAEEVRKIKVQLEAQIKLDKASVTNCETNYPGIEDVTEDEEKRAIAITLRKGNLKEIAQFEEKLAEIDEALVEYEAEIEEIKKQTGING